MHLPYEWLASTVRGTVVCGSSNCQQWRPAVTLAFGPYNLAQSLLLHCPPWCSGMTADASSGWATPGDGKEYWRDWHDRLQSRLIVHPDSLQA